MMRMLVCVFSLSLSFSQGASAEGIAGVAGTVAAGYAVSAGANKVMGDKMEKICSPLNGWACIIGAAAVGQVLLDVGSAKSSSGVKTNVEVGNFGGGDSPSFTDPTTGRPIDLKQVEKDARKAKAALKEKGFEFDPKTGAVKTPKGTASAAQLQSGQALADAGLLDPSMIGEYDKTLKEHKDKIRVSTLGAAGGGGYTSAKRKPSSFDDGADYGFRPGIGEIQPAKTSGLSKNFGNDPVGIATDDLFEMVHRRYQSLTAKENFK